MARHRTGRPNGRPPSRPANHYEPPPRPTQVHWKCEACGQQNLVWLDDMLYADVTKAAAVCGKCAAPLGGGKR